MALIAAQKLRIAKLEHQIYGQRSERSARLIDQLALEFEELSASATEDELAAEQAAAKTTTVRAFTRRRAERDTFPDHLPRERVVIDPPTACARCGGNRLRKLGEDVTQTLETTPRRWKVIETVREKFSCRDCEKISQASAPFPVIPRAWAGPSGAGPPAAIFHYSRDRRTSTRRRIWRATSASCKRTPTTATTSSISQTASPARSGRRRAGRMRGASSSFSPTSRRMCAARPVERARFRSRRSPSR